MTSKVMIYYAFTKVLKIEYNISNLVMSKIQIFKDFNLTLGYRNLKFNRPKSVKKQNLVRKTQSCGTEGRVTESKSNIVM